MANERQIFCPRGVSIAFADLQWLGFLMHPDWPKDTLDLEGRLT